MKSTERKKTKPKTYNELPDLLTITQAAHLLNVHNDTLRNWEKRGLIKSIRIGARGDRRYERKLILKIAKQGLLLKKYDSKS